MKDQRLTRNQYQAAINEKRAVAPQIQPIKQQELIQEVKQYEKNIQDISIWPFIGLINWALRNAAKNGDTELVTSLTHIIKLGSIRLDLDGNPVENDTLHTVRGEIINNYAKKYANYLDQKDLSNCPASGWSRIFETVK